MWFYLVVAVVIAVTAISLQPKPTEVRPATLSDVDAPTAEEGRPIPVVFGTCIIQSPNIVWYGDLKYKKIKVKTGK